MRKMKDSGVAWVGAIPEDWTVKRGKFTLKLLNRPVQDTDDVITCFRDGEVTLRTNRRTDGFTVSVKEIGYQGIEPGDLVIHGMDGFAGSIGISDSRGKSSPVLVVCDTDESKRYIMYYLRSMAYNDVFTALATGIRVRSCDLRWNKLAELPYILPSLPEQNQIVSAIESNTSKVDALIANVQAQIEKLKAYKQSLITEVVTKGLDPTVPMKDSGVAWIGTVPEHWTVIRLKYLYDFSNGSPVRVGPFGSSLSGADITTEGVWVYNQRTVIDQNFISNTTFVSPKKAEALDSFKVKSGDILITTRGSIGKTAVIPNNAPSGILHPCVIRFRIDSQKMNKELLSLIFNETNLCLGQILDMSNSTTIEVLYSYSLKEIQIPCPPMFEQESLLIKVKEIITKTNQLISLKQSKIEKLEQYKRSLIYEYVTGKKEVS